MQDTHNPTATQRAWIFAAALLMSMSWLISIKAAPWSNLYQEAWAALSIALVLGILLYRSKPAAFQFSWASALCLGLLFIPAIQYALGLILWWGDAVIQTAYLAGLLMVITATQQLDQRAQHTLLTAIALSLVLASCASVLLQWFQLSGFRLAWLRQEIYITRPSANLSQPNHLGTLLVLGLVSAHFLFRQAWISRALLLLISALLNFGIALTASRTALLGVVAVVAWHAYAQRRGREDKDPHWTAVLLMLVLAQVFVWLMWQHFPFGAMLDHAFNPELLRTHSAQRLDAWLMFVHRVIESPWVGYGMGQVGIAHLIGETHVHPFGALFQSAHNIALDVLLWVGIPLGISILGAGTYIVARALTMATDGQRLASGAIVAILNHALLEYPLFYSYFLLSLGVFIGANTPRLNSELAHAKPTQRWMLVPLALLVAATGKLTWDFKQTSTLLVTTDLTKPKDPSSTDPDLGINKHWLRLVHYSRLDLHQSSQPVDLQELRALFLRVPTAHMGLNYAIQLQTQGATEQAQYWLRHTCNVQSQQHCDYLKKKWTALPALHASQPNATWPTTIFDASSSESKRPVEK